MSLPDSSVCKDYLCLPHLFCFHASKLKLRRNSILKSHQSSLLPFTLLPSSGQEWTDYQLQDHCTPKQEKGFMPSVILLFSYMPALVQGRLTWLLHCPCCKNTRKNCHILPPSFTIYLENWGFDPTLAPCVCCLLDGGRISDCFLPNLHHSHSMDVHKGIHASVCFSVSAISSLYQTHTPTPGKAFLHVSFSLKEDLHLSKFI